MLKKYIKKYGGAIPFAIFVLCGLCLTIIEMCTSYTLRIIPRNILICFGIVSFGVFLVWINKIIHRKKPKVFSVLSKVISIIAFVVLVWSSTFFMIFSYTPEHVVMRNEIKMVARVRSFLEVYVDYYQYKNVLFMGKELGYEYYGNGGYDPFVDGNNRKPFRWEIYDLDGNIIDEGYRER